MNELKQDQKLFVEYIYFQGDTHYEDSEEIDIPLGTVKSKVRAAIQLLKKNVARI